MTSSHPSVSGTNTAQILTSTGAKDSAPVVAVTVVAMSCVMEASTGARLKAPVVASIFVSRPIVMNAGRPV